MPTKTPIKQIQPSAPKPQATDEDSAASANTDKYKKKIQKNKLSVSMSVYVSIRQNTSYVSMHT